MNLTIANAASEAARWTSLRSLGNSLPVKLTVIIPLVGYLIIFNDSVIQYLTLSRHLFGIETEPQLPVRLLLTYFGLCLVAVGSIIFSIYCLWEIKKYQSPTEYIGGELENMSIIEFLALADRLDSNAAVGKRVKNHSKLLAQRYATGGPWNRDEETEADGLLSYFLILDREYRFARFANAAFFISGLIALSLPALDVFFRVLAVILRRMI